MVLKNKNLQKLEKVANRTPHFGIRKLTIGAASVLLGTTLWLGKDAVLAQAADQTNANEGSNDAKAVTESDKSADNSVDANTKVIVNSNQATDSSAVVSSDKSSSAVVSQSGADKSQNITGNVSDSAKTNIENNQTSSAAKQSSAQSSVTQNNANSSTTSQKQVSPAARADNAIKEQAQSIQSKLSQSRNDIAASAESKLGLNADLTPAQQAQKSIQQAGNQGKVDLDNLDLTKGINAAANQTDANLGAKNVLGNKLALKANASNSSAVLQNNTNDSNNVDSNENGASLVGGANVSANDGQNADTSKINKVVVDQNNQDQATSILSQGNDALIAAAKQSATELFDKKASSFEAPAALLASLDQVPGAAGQQDTADYNQANNWADVQNALNANAAGIIINGNITADSDLDIAAGKNFTIVGKDNNSTLTLGSNVINNGGNLTLENINIKGNVLGQGTVNIQGTVNSTVDSNSKHSSLGDVETYLGKLWEDQNSKDKTYQRNRLHDKWGLVTSDYTYPNSTANWYNANIAAGKVNITTGATLNINRSVNGDGIDLGQTGAVNVGINGNLNITLKDGTENYKSLRSTEKNKDIENANTAIRALNSGTFTTEDGSVINLNVGHGRGIVFNEPFGGNADIQVADQTAFYRARYDAGLDNQGGASTVALGPNTTLNLSGRDGFVLGNHAKFTTGDFSNITFHNGGNGVGLQMDAQAVAEISPHSTMIMLSDGKNKSGVFNAMNYIGLGENAQFTVDHDAAFIYKLTNAWNNTSLNYADNFNIVSVKRDSNPTVNIKNNAIFDGESDYRNIFGELLSFSWNDAPVKSTVNIDGARYVNFQRHGATTPGGWQNIVATDPQGKHSGNLFYSWPANTWNVNGNTYNVYKWTDETDSQDTFDGTTYDKLVQSIKDLNNASSEYWKGVKNLTLGVNMHRSNLTDQTPNTKTGVKNGWQSDDKNGYGFDTEFSQRLALVATKIPAEEVLQNNEKEGYNTQIIYDANLKPGQVELAQKGIKSLTRTTKIAYYTVDLSDPNNPTRVLDTTKGDHGYQTTQTVLIKGQDEIIHVGPQTATINYLKKDGNNAATPIQDASGQNIVGTAIGVPIATKTDGTIIFDAQGNTTPAKIYYNEGHVLSADNADLQKAEQAAGSDYKYDVNRDDWSQAVNLGTNVYNNQGLTKAAIIAAADKLQEGQKAQLGVAQGPSYNVVLFKSEHVAQNIEQVSITQKVQRNIEYKNNANRDTINYPNGADRNKAAGLNDMGDSVLNGKRADGNLDAQGNIRHEQSITLKGIAYLDTATGKFVNVQTQNGHPVDANGNYIAVDDNGNAVVGDLQADGTVKARLTNGKTTLTEYVIKDNGQGTFAWSLDDSDAKGFKSPGADGYTINPGNVPALDASQVHVTFNDKDGKPIIAGKTSPTLQQVLDYLNNESAQEALQQAVSQDALTDPANYPQMPQVPATQYIFEQYRVTDPHNNDWNVVVTLTVDRDDPQGNVHVYFTSADYRQTYWTVNSEVNDAGGPVWWSAGNPFTVRVHNFGSQNGSVSVTVDNNYNLRPIYEYDGTAETANLYGESFGSFKPRLVTQTIHYIDTATGQEIPGYPAVKVTGLIGQHFDANGVNKLNIPGYTLDQDNSDTPSGTISDYVPGQTYTRTWVEVNGNIVREAFTLKDDKNADGTLAGTMHVVVSVNGQRVAERDLNADDTFNIPANNLTISNPYVPSTKDVNLRYTENPINISKEDSPFYVVYTPNAKGTVNVIFHDTTTNTDITGYGPTTPLTGDEGTAVTGYTPDADITTLEGKGYVLDTTSPIPTGDLSSMPAKYTNGNQTVYINLKHGLEDVNKNNPHDLDVDRKVSRQINYTIDGQPATQPSLASQKQEAEFERTGHWDKVDHKLVDVQNGQIVTENGQTVDGHLSDWKVISGNSDFAGFDKPTLAGYHVDSVTANPTTALNDNAVTSGTNEGQVKEVTATADYGKVIVTIDLTKDAAEKANLKIVDDTTGKILNDGISAEGDENTPISFATGESTVQGYLNNHYRFVSVVNDADPNNPLSTTSYADGAAKFGNYDTDPKTDQNFTVHLVHQIDRIDRNNPHGQKVTATVTRKVNYTVDGVADSSLPSHTETADFNATGYYDEVTNKVVDLVDGTTIEQGKVILDNGNEADGHLTWTVDGGTTDSSTLTGYAVPTKKGYKVNSVTVDPAADKDANADDTGLVKDLTVTHESHDVTININLTKEPVKDVQDVVNYIDDTTGKTLRTDTGSVFKTLIGKQNDKVTYTTADIIKGYTDQGYRLVSNDFNDGHETFGKADKTYNVHLAHKVETFTGNNPYGITAKATVTRQINYTVNGVPDSTLPSHTETANFSATGHYDLVEHKVVDMVNGQEKVTNGQVDDGHLIWTVDGGTQDSSTFAGYAVPTKAGYHVNNVTVAPVADTDDNAVVDSKSKDYGLVKDLLVNHESHNVTININLTNNTPQADVQDIVNYIDDTTGQTLRTDNGAQLDTLKGKPTDKVNYTTTGIIKGYTDQGYRLVSNDFHDGQESFGNSAKVYNVHLAHQVVDVDKNNPHGYTVTATVTRQVNYTVDGVPDSSLQSHTETANFSATGHYDLVEHKLVDMVNGSEKVTNGKVDDGHLTWTYTLNGGAAQNGDSTTFTGYAVPTKHGYHVNSVTVNPSADTNDNAIVDSKSKDYGLVKDLSVNTKSHDVTITINLTKDAPAANVADIVNYIDDTTGQTLRTDNGDVINTLTGKPNGQVTYTTADIIKGYTDQGYRLVSNDFNDGHEVFGSTGHTYNVHLAHQVVVIDKNTPYGNPVTASVTRKVNYTVDGVADSTLPSHTETANFSATGHYDLVEHKVVDMVNGQEKVTNGRVDEGHLTWAVDGGTADSSTLTGYAVPTKAGYHVNGVTVDPAADKDANADDTGLVKDLSVNHTSHNVTVTINLTKNGQTTKNQQTIDTSATVHYVIDGDDADKPAAPADSVQNGFQFNYSGDIYDATTGTLIRNGQWNATSHAYTAITSPAINGYHAEITVVPSSQLTVTHDNPNVTVTVHYIKNGQETRNQQDLPTSATVHYVVDGDDADKPAAPADNVQKGFTFSYSGDIYDKFTGRLIHQGSWNAESHAYDAVTTPALNGYHAEVTVVPASQLTVNRFNRDVVVTVHYVKNGQTTRNEQDINTKATVHYIIDGDDANKPAAPTDNVQDNFRFHYSGDIYDTTTNRMVTPGHWNYDSHAYDAVTPLPTVTGYHAVDANGNTITSVPASQLTVTRDNPTVEVTVHYVKNGTTVKNQQTVTASQKVEYQDDQGNTLSPEKDQNFTFNYTGDTYDKVTGDLISRGHWTVASHNFTGENVPVINGYVAVSGYTKNGDSYTAGGFDTIPTASDAERNRTFIVVYKKTSNIVPVDPNHNPIPNAPTPEYPNDPKNPTNVTPNEPVPNVPGYTPTQPTVTPTDPTKPTEVVYTRDQVAQVVYRDVNDPQNIITLDTDGNLTGKSGDAVKDDQVPTKISNFEEKGYVLVSNGFNNPVFDNIAGNVQTFYVDFKHQTTTVTPDKPGHPGQPVNPDNPNGPKYPTGTDLNQVKRTGTQTIHYQGAGDKTPADNKQSFDFTRTITFDDVTGKIITTTPWNVSSHTFGNVDTPVVPGYHADKGTAGGTTITPDDLTKTVVVTYSPNGKIVPVDPNHNPIPSAPTPQYPTDPKNPTNVTPNEPVPTVPGYTPTQPTVTPTDPGKDTPVVYVKDQVAQVIYQDINDPEHVITLGTDTGLTGKAGDPVKDDQVQTKITNFENAGYVLVSNGFTGAVFDDVPGNTQTFYVTFKHDTITINPNNPGKPGQPINPNDPNGPKWSDDTDVKHLTKDGTQTIHYQGAGDNTPKDNVQKTTFNHEEVIDKVTGKVIADHGWSPDSHTFGTVTTPVVNGYHADRTTAGGATVTPDNPDATIVVSYSPNGKIIPVDPNGNPIPNAPQPQYPTSPDNPTTVTPDEPVPTIPGYTPEHNTVTPTDPGKDTPVIYNPVTPKEVQGKQTVTFVDQDGNQLHDPSVTDHTFTKPGESFTYGNVTVPVIPGYVASKTTAGGKTGTYENPNVTDQIVYTKIGKIVPVDNNGNPIPGASQPIYNNDPKDPTKVVPNEAVPTVPGYNVDKNQNTPGFNKDTETVTPVDPTKDTKVVYNKPAQPNEPDEPQGPTTPQQPTNAPSQPTSAPSQPTIAPVHPENPAQPTNAPSQPTNAPQPSNVPPHAEPNPTEPSPAPEPAPIAPKAQNNPVAPKANTVQPKSQTYVPAQNAAAPAPTQTASGNTETALPQTGENEDNSIAAALAGGAAISISLIGLAGVRKRRRD